jgi:HSP20 family molecular chaperone IbpA
MKASRLAAAIPHKTTQRAFLLKGHRPVSSGSATENKPSNEAKSNTSSQQVEKQTSPEGSSLSDSSASSATHLPSYQTTQPGFISPFSMMSADPFFRDIDRIFDTQRHMMNSLFRDFFQPSPLSTLTTRIPTYPLPYTPRQSVWGEPSLSPNFAKVDVAENDKSYVVHVDLPGVKKEEIEVSIKEDVVTIQGERKVERKDDKVG